MPKKISIGSKTITLTQFIIGIVLGVFALAGGFFGILKAEDRWNQKPACEQNSAKSAQLEKDLTAGMQQMFYQQNVRFEEQRLQSLYDQLAQAKVDLAHNPNDPTLQERVRYLQSEIEKTKDNLQKLHSERVN